MRVRKRGVKLILYSVLQHSVEQLPDVVLKPLLTGCSIDQLVPIELYAVYLLSFPPPLLPLLPLLSLSLLPSVSLPPCFSHITYSNVIWIWWMRRPVGSTVVLTVAK